MFRSATLRLTIWYVLLITGVSLLFSVVLYHFSSTQLADSLHHQSVYFENNYGMPSQPDDDHMDAATLGEGIHHIWLNLVIFNLVILALASVTGYGLARRTLKPIEAAHLAQKRFTSDASHELRTPLTAMKAEIEVMLRSPKPQPAQMKALLMSNLEEVEKLEKLSTTLLRLAQEEEGYRAAFVTCKLAAVIEAAVKETRELAKLRQITVSAEPSALKVLGDFDSLVQLLVILLDNAIKYSPDGAQVAIAAKQHGSQIRLTVTDSGIGIGPADLPHVFERFYRAEPSRSKTQVGGFGLGLPLAEMIARAHGGQISITSRLDHGTTVTVELPLGR